MAAYVVRQLAGAGSGRITIKNILINQVRKCEQLPNEIVLQII